MSVDCGIKMVWVARSIERVGVHIGCALIDGVVRSINTCERFWLEDFVCARMRKYMNALVFSALRTSAFRSYSYSPVTQDINSCIMPPDRS